MCNVRLFWVRLEDPALQKAAKVAEKHQRFLWCFFSAFLLLCASRLATLIRPLSPLSPRPAPLRGSVHVDTPSHVAPPAAARQLHTHTSLRCGAPLSPFPCVAKAVNQALCHGRCTLDAALQPAGANYQRTRATHMPVSDDCASKSQSKSQTKQPKSQTMSCLFPLSLSLPLSALSHPGHFCFRWEDTRLEPTG